MEPQRSNSLLINFEEVETLLDRKPPIREVCICGHSMRRHESFGDGKSYCQVAKTFCPCETPKSVIEVEDTRPFMYNTNGYGSLHALFRGIKRLNQMGKSYRLTLPSNCWACGQGADLQPVPINQFNEISNKGEARNALLCLTCLYKWQGIPVEVHTVVNSPNLDTDGSRANSTVDYWPSIYDRFADSRNSNSA